MINSLEPSGYSNSVYDVSHERGPLDTNFGRVKELLGDGENFDVVERSPEDRIGEGNTIAEGVNPFEAVNILLSRRENFDRYMATWNEIGEPNRLRVYENLRNGFLGNILPKRGEQLIFKYNNE